MTDLALNGPLRPQFRPGLHVTRLYRDEPAMMATAVALALLIVPLSAAGLLDPRLHLGVNVWIKPVKFAVALSVYTATLAVFARFLTEKFRARRGYRWFTASVIGAIAAEMIWITGAAALDVASHFNSTEPLLIALYPVMGALATLLTSATAVYAWGIGRNRATGLSSELKEALVIGLALTLPLTLATAGTMSGLGAHAVGGSGTDAGGLALMGWLRDGGDLRVAHFFATHAMHVLPLFGLAALALPKGSRRSAIRGFSVLWVAFVALVLVQAMAGRPFLPGLG